MSEALERVIAEQQAQIDRLKEQIESSVNAANTAFTKHAELFEAVGRLLHENISSCWKDDKADELRRYNNNKHAVRMHLLDAGFCMGCYSFVCECDPEDF